MTELLQHVIDRLRNIPAGDQDRVARDIAEMLEEYPTTDELAAITDGRAQFERWLDAEAQLFLIQDNPGR